jgi:hypothetical protein
MNVADITVHVFPYFFLHIYHIKMLQIKVIDFRAIFYIMYQFTCVLNNFCRCVVKSDNEVKIVVDGSGQKLTLHRGLLNARYVSPLR